MKIIFIGDIVGKSGREALLVSLNDLKKIKHKFISIAVAFDDQKIDELVHDKYDQKINYILTEKKLYKV